MSKKNRREKNLIKWWIMVCMAAVLLAGCGKNTAEEPKGALPQKEEETAKLVLSAYSDKGIMQDAVSKSIDLLSYVIEMPEISLAYMDKGGAAAFIDFWEQEKNECDYQMKTMYWSADDTYLGMLQWEEEGNETTDIPVWNYEVGYQVLQNDADYLSLCKKETYFSGGAHGSYILTGIVLDAESGRRLTLDDFLTGRENEKVYLAEYLIEQLSEREEELWDNYDEIVVDMVCSSPNFYVEEDKLVFVFGQYELASYAAGIQFADIPISKLANLEKEVQDKQQAEAYVQRLKEPCALNSYLVEIPAGEPYDVDLDGDGTQEEILFPKDGVIDEYQARILVDGTAYEFVISDQVEDRFIGLMDINEMDGTYELAVYADGPSDDPLTVFLRYRDGSLYEIGSAGVRTDRAEMNAGNVYTLGSGAFYGKVWMNTPLETRWINATWTLDGDMDQVAFTENDYYTSFTASSAYENEREKFPYNLLDCILLYVDADRGADYNTVEAEGNRILGFYGYSGENWVQAAVLADGEIRWGWIYVEDWQVEVERDRFVSTDQVIENLCRAG